MNNHLETQDVLSALKHVNLLASGRTNYEGKQIPYDEVLLNYTKQLYEELYFYECAQTKYSDSKPPLWGQAALNRASQLTQIRLTKEAQFPELRNLMFS